MVSNVLRLVLAVNWTLKALNRVEKILICVVVNSNPRVSPLIPSGEKPGIRVKETRGSIRNFCMGVKDPRRCLKVLLPKEDIRSWLSRRLRVE